MKKKGKRSAEVKGGSECSRLKGAAIRSKIGMGEVDKIISAMPGLREPIPGKDSISYFFPFIGVAETHNPPTTIDRNPVDEFWGVKEADQKFFHALTESMRRDHCRIVPTNQIMAAERRKEEKR